MPAAGEMQDLGDRAAGHATMLAMSSYWDVEAKLAMGRLRPLVLADAEAQNLPVLAFIPYSKNVPTRMHTHRRTAAMLANQPAPRLKSWSKEVT